MQEQLIIGQITKAHGLKGEVKIRSFADDPERFLALRDCQLEDPNGQVLRTLKVRKARAAGREVFLSFVECSDREAAEALKGLYLSVPREKAQTLDANSWYVCDLIGLSVYDRETLLGKVTEVLSTGHRDLLEVESDTAKKIYIPLNRIWLQDVDLIGGSIQFELPEGLVEIFD